MLPLKLITLGCASGYFLLVPISTTHSNVLMVVFQIVAQTCARTKRNSFGVYAHCARTSAAQVFGGIVGAFDAVVRQMFMGLDKFPDDDESIARLLMKLGFAPEEMHNIASIIWSVPVMESSAYPLTLPG